jgi:hypothetical protein
MLLNNNKTLSFLIKNLNLLYFTFIIFKKFTKFQTVTSRDTYRQPTPKLLMIL